MKFYLSTDIPKFFKESINLEKKYVIINTNLVKKKYGVFNDKSGKKSREYSITLINLELKKLMLSYCKRKKYEALVYVVNKIDTELVDSLILFFEENNIYFTEKFVVIMNNDNEIIEQL